MRISLVLVTMAVTAVAMRAQNEAVIRSETRVVLVDVAAVDRQGSPVRDLTEKDFRIQEDGKEQKISSFSLGSAALSPEQSQKHCIVLFFDTSTLSATAVASMRQEALRFVDGFASPDRYMAVVQFAGGLRILRNLTADPAQIKAALSTIQGSSAGSASASNAAARSQVTGGSAADTYSFSSMMASLRSVADSLGPIRGRKALVLFSGGTIPNGDITDALLLTTDALNRANVAVYAVSAPTLLGEASPRRKNRVGAIFAALSALAPSPDSAAMSFFQGRGMPADASTAAPTPGNAGVRPTLPGTSGAGNNPGGNPSIVASTDMKAVNEGVLRSLAEATGGMMLTASNDLAGALGKIAQEQDGYYLLGYTPSVDAPEGSCHTLHVTTSHSGITVRARKGYCTVARAALTGGGPAAGGLEAKALGTSPGTMAAKMQIPYFYSRPDVAHVNLTMDIVTKGMKFQKDKGKLHGELDIAGVADANGGAVAARFSDRVRMDFDSQQEADNFLAAPYRYTRQFDIAPGQYSFHVAFASSDQNFGKAEMPLAIGPWDGKTLSVSGLVLSHAAHPATDLASDLDPSLLEGAHPLISQGTEVVPAASSQFRAGERGFFYFEAYEPKMSTPPPVVAVRYRVLDRATGRQISDSGGTNASNFIRPGSAVVPIGLVLPSATLAPGAYRLEVSVSDDAAGTPVVRLVDFDVN